MATKLFGAVKVGATSVSLDVLLLKTADNTPDTGKVAADLTVYYYRSTITGGAIVDCTSSLSNLSALSSAFSAYGVKEIGDGSYRFDAPDAMWVTEADWVELTVKNGTTSLFKERFALAANGPDEVIAALPTWPTNFASLSIDSSGRVDVGKILGSASAGSAGHVGIDWGQIANPTAAGVNLSGTTIGMTGGVSGNISGSVASVTSPVTVDSGSKSGYELAATGLNLIPVTDPGGVAGQTTFPKILVALYRRFFKKTTLTATELTTYADDGSTVRTTQTVSDNGTTQEQGAAT